MRHARQTHRQGRKSRRGLAILLALLLGAGCGSSSDTTEAGTQSSIDDPPNTASQLPATESPTPEPSQTPTVTGPPPGEATAIPTTANPGVDLGCAEIAAESHYCLTTSGASIEMLGLETGRLCPIVDTDAPFDAFPLINASLAWADDALFVCGETGLLRISLRDGTWEAAGAPCGAVALYDDGLLVNRWLVDIALRQGPRSPLSWYPSFADVASESPQRTFDLGGFSASMTVQGQTLYTAWHAGVGVELSDLSNEQSLGVLTLEDYNGWMLGMSVTADGYLALAGDPWGESVYVFDAYDGRQLRRFDLDRSIAGLACVAADDAPPRPTPTATPTATINPQPTATPCADSFACSDPCADWATHPAPFRLSDLPPSLASATSCDGGYGASNYAVREELLTPGAGEELHVIGIYEAAGDPGLRPNEQGVVDVVVHARSKPIALALSSYQGMRWRLALDPGVELSRVILQGFAPQHVDGVPAGVPVIERSPEQSCGFAYGWEVLHNDGGGDYEAMLAGLRRYTGLVETSFQGCYSGNQFEIPYWTGEPPTAKPTPVPGNEDLPRSAVAFPGCETVTAEAEYCLTTTQDQILVVGLESGQTCPVAPTVDPNPSSFLGGTLAWRGEILYSCPYGVGLVRTSLLDGSSQPLQIRCDAVTTYGDDLLIADDRGWNLSQYTSLEELLAKRASRSIAFGGAFLSFITTQDEVLYSTPWYIGEVSRLDLVTEQALPAIQLQGYDRGSYGLAVTESGEIALVGDAAEPSLDRVLYLFDAATGTQRQSFTLPMGSVGLACSGGNTAPE